MSQTPEHHSGVFRWADGCIWNQCMASEKVVPNQNHLLSVSGSRFGFVHSFNPDSGEDVAKQLA